MGRMNVRELREHLMDYPDDLPVVYFVQFGYNDVNWIDLEEGLTDRDTDGTVNAVVIGG